MTLWIFTQQKASLPSWAPFVGEDFVHLTADFSDAQAVTPGQGQAVVIAGIQVGKINSVDLEDGHAVVGMDIEPKYLELIHPDATLLLRPKTNLNDMTVEISTRAAATSTSKPGTASRSPRPNRASSSKPSSHQLDTDTQPATSSCSSPAARRESAAAAGSSAAPSGACSPSPTTSRSSTGPSPAGASRSPM